MKATYFENGKAFRKWLAANHNKAEEIVVGYYKVATGKPSMTWSESVDEALCYGWIDGIRRSVDEERYTIRFTPRRPKSKWSKVNVEKVETLEKQGRMRKPGLAAYALRTAEASGVYSYENKLDLDAAMKRRFRKNKVAWKNFEAMPPGYQKTAKGWVMSAKREATRERRLATLMECSEAGERIPSLRRG